MRYPNRWFAVLRRPADRLTLLLALLVPFGLACAGSVGQGGQPSDPDASNGRVPMAGAPPTDGPVATAGGSVVAGADRESARLPKIDFAGLGPQDATVAAGGAGAELVQADDARVTSRVRLFRLWSGLATDHFYTTSIAERDLAVRDLGYVLEDELIYVHDTAGDGRRPLHRYYSEVETDHFYTALGDGGSIPGYVYEGIACYVYVTPGDNRVRLFRLWNASSRDHGYSTRASSAPGYAAEPWEQIWVYDNFGYYGFFYTDYTASNHDLAQLRQWTNTGFASSMAQLEVLLAFGFERVIYSFDPYAVLPRVGVDPGSPEFRARYFAALREALGGLRQALAGRGYLGRVTDFYIADEPALHRDLFKDQAFLDRYADEFKGAFPAQRLWAAFAQVLPSQPHLNPPPRLDGVVVDPYFWDQGLAVDAVSKYLYEAHPNSALNWAKQFDKPIIVAGHAMYPVRNDLVEREYQVLRNDPAVIGLVWFIYDKTFVSGGAGQHPALVDFIRGLRVVP